MGNTASNNCLMKNPPRKLLKHSKELQQEDDDEIYDLANDELEASCSQIEDRNTSQLKPQRRNSSRKWLAKRLTLNRRSSDKEVLGSIIKRNNLDRFRDNSLNNTRPMVTVGDVVVKWKSEADNVNLTDLNVSHKALTKSASVASGRLFLPNSNQSGGADPMTNEFLMQIIRCFPFPTPRNSPRPNPRSNRRHRSLLERGQKKQNNEEDETNRIISRRKSESKLPCYTNSALNQIVKNTVDTIAVTALPLDCWLKERLKHFCQLSGHEGTIVPATENTLWKKQNPADGSKEANAYKLMMNDAVCVCIPNFLKDIEYKGDNFIEIEDLTRKFNHPAIMDVKMGTRTFLEAEVTNPVLRKDLYEKMTKIDANEPTEQEREQKAITKLRYMQFRERESTTAELGFRIEAIKMPGKPCQKTFQKVHSRDEVIQVLLRYISGQRLNEKSDKAMENQLRKHFCRRLKVIRDKIQKSVFFRSHEVIGSSLLFMYDDTGKSGVWMIDFAKSLPVEGKNLDHRSSWKMGNHEDGYLIGIDNFIQIFEDTQHVELSPF